MRPLNSSEEQNLKTLTENSVSLTLIEPTKTGLEKSIMDATGSVRNYLKTNGFHDYGLQSQGPENKIIIDAIIYSENLVLKSKTSLYRPRTKKGDPRIWFSGLTKYSKPNDILALICFDRKIHILNLTQLPVEQLLNSALINPLKELIQEVNIIENKVSQELLSKLRNISKDGFVKSLVNADTGIGRTLEKLLGIEMNSSKSPDYKGIELKSFRDSRNTRKGLFGKTPDWDLSKFKSRVEILDNFGYWEEGIFRLYTTVRGTGRNAQGVMLKLEQEKDWLVENSDRKDIGDFIVWELDVLKKALLKKHKETFWISTESKNIDGNEYFLYEEAEHTKNPLVNQFELLVEMGAITVDYPIKRTPDGKVTDKGCNFKLKASCLDLMFPPSNTYNLLS